MSATVEFSGASKHYGRVTALDSLDLAVQPGEVLGLLGHNGAGKTTAIKLIVGLVQPSEGSVLVFGAPTASVAAARLRNRLGYLPENVHFYPQLSGREVLRYCAQLKHATTAQVDELLDEVGLSDAAERRVKTYSKGMRQRLGLAQALLGEPGLLLLDEPTVGLDPAATRSFYDLVDRMRRRGVAIILSSHVLAGIERHIDRAAILSHGRLLASGSLDDLRRAADLPLVIRARGMLDVGAVQQLGVRTQRLNGNEWELQLPPREKLGSLRVLLDLPGIEDVDVETPNLDTIYAHFGTRRDGPQP